MFNTGKIRKLERRIIDQGNDINNLKEWINALSSKLNLFRDTSDPIDQHIIYLTKKEFKVRHPDIPMAPRITVKFHDGSIYQHQLKTKQKEKK